MRVDELAAFGLPAPGVEVGDTGTTFPLASVVAMAPVLVEKPLFWPVNELTPALTTFPISTEVALSSPSFDAPAGRLGEPW